jgi:hypothetical protein
MILQLVMIRNVLILCPHPAAIELCLHGIGYLHDVGMAANAVCSTTRRYKGSSSGRRQLTVTFQV